MRIRTIVGLTSLIGLTLCVGPAWAGTINVDGADAGCVASPQGDPYSVVYCTIQDAITDAAASDTIDVASGTYTEDLTIDKGVSLLGGTTIDGTILVTSGGVTIDGFTLAPSSPAVTITLDSSGSAIAGVAITNNVFEMPTSPAVAIWLGGGAPTNMVSEVDITGNTFNGPGDDISNPFKIGGEYGTPLSARIDDVVFSGNTINDGSIPINLQDADISNVVIDGNTFNSTDGLVYVWGESTRGAPTGVLSGFKFSNNWADSSNSYGVGIDLSWELVFDDANFGLGNEVIYNSFDGIPGKYGFGSVSLLSPVTSYVLKAENNWWGAPGGPSDPAGSVEVIWPDDCPDTDVIKNGTSCVGLGGGVSENVDYCPWLMGGIGDCDCDGLKDYEENFNSWDWCRKGPEHPNPCECLDPIDFDRDGVPDDCDSDVPPDTCCDPITGIALPLDDYCDCTVDTCSYGAVHGTPVHTPNHSVCDDDNECTTDVCDPATCVARSVGIPTGCINDPVPAGTPCGDPSDTDCDNPDTCDEAGTCQDNHEPDGPAPAGMCDDGNDCTQNKCLAGDCDNPNEPPGTPCDDGEYCNGADTCDSSGECSIHAGDPCSGSDGDDDCAESCDEDNDNCLAHDLNGSDCDNELYCDGTETCTDGVCGSSTGDPCPGPDGDDDCAESCDEVADNCTAADPYDSPCDDELYCTGTDKCSGGTCSMHSGDPCPGPDGDDDCAESCDEDNDNCLAHDPNGSDCDDGLYCDGTETCTDGVCGSSTGDPCPCPETPCNSCNEVDESCYDPPGTPCDDGVYCNGADTCDGAGTCVHDAAAMHGDDCDDGLFCTDNDTCQNVLPSGLSFGTIGTAGATATMVPDGVELYTDLGLYGSGYVRLDIDGGIALNAITSLSYTAKVTTPSTHSDGYDPAPEVVLNIDADSDGTLEGYGILWMLSSYDPATLGYVDSSDRGDNFLSGDPDPGSASTPDTCFVTRDAIGAGYHYWQANDTRTGFGTTWHAFATVLGMLPVHDIDATDNVYSIDIVVGTSPNFDGLRVIVQSIELNGTTYDLLPGVCTGGSAHNCDDGNECTDDSCDEKNDQCVNTCTPGVECDDGDDCTVYDVCVERSVDCVCEGIVVETEEPQDCHPDSCDECSACPGGACDSGTCVGGDYDGNPCDPNDARDDCLFDPDGLCPDAGFRLAVLKDPSDLSCPAIDPENPECETPDPPSFCFPRPDCTTDPPECEEVLGCGSPFFVEIWVTKFSPDLDPDPPHDPGISCAYVDLVSYVSVGEVGIEYGAAFDAGPAFEHGTFVGNGGVTDLGACNFGPGGVGVWPEWVLVARVELQQDHGGNMRFELTDPTSADEQLATSVYGQGYADPVAYGEECQSIIDCRGHIYDLDSDCYIGPGDLTLFAGCWLRCPGDPLTCTGGDNDGLACATDVDCPGDPGGLCLNYDNAFGLYRESCDRANFVMCDDYDCVDSADFSFFHTAWLKWCDDGTIILSDADDNGVDDACELGLRSAVELPPLATDELLRSFGLEPPSDDWKDYRRGILREWERLETRRRLTKEPLPERERPRDQRGR